MLIRHIPSLITMGNLSCGFLAILIADPFYSPLLVLFGAFLDLFDGLVARALGVASEFGKQLDSLSDMVSFGVAPAFLYAQLMPGESWYYYIGSVLIVVGAAMRLAIFNVAPSSKYFIGLATPSSGFFIIGIVLASYFESEMISKLLSIPLVYIGLGLLMIVMNLVPLKMFSVKSLGVNKTNKVMMSLLVIGMIALLIYNPYIALPLVILWYIILSIVMNLLGKTESLLD